MQKQEFLTIPFQNVGLGSLITEWGPAPAYFVTLQYRLVIWKWLHVTLKLLMNRERFM